MTANYVIPAHLHLVCGKCTREAGFEGETKEAAEAVAAKAGWRAGKCPKCAPHELFRCPCGHVRNLKPGDTQKYCPACKTVAA